MTNTPSIRFVRIAALLALAIGALISIYLTLLAGQNNRSVILPILFVGWVLSPFILLLFANRVATRWSVSIQRGLYGLMVFITLISLISYSGVWKPAGTQPAFMFTVVPLICWLIISTIALLVRKQLFNK